MTATALVLRHLCFTGPGVRPASLDFSPGLNVLYGASETGKSFVLEAVDFMLGGRGPLRDIPERVGYDTVLLGVETTIGEGFTLVRSTAGGQFRLYEGLHKSTPTDISAAVLSAQHSGTTEDNLSSVLLSKIGLRGRRVRKNAAGITRSLSFRDLCRLCLVPEDEMQKVASPLESGLAVGKTAEYAVFKLLLTGVDDRSLVPAVASTAATQSRSAKVALLDELLVSLRERLEDEEGLEELSEQLAELENGIARAEEAVRSVEGQHEGLVMQWSGMRRKLQSGTDRRAQIRELLARFALLQSHYQSDLQRLEGVREAGALVGALSPQPCPLCGAEPDCQHRDGECDGNLEAVVAAADAETAKIRRLLGELEETVAQLRLEAASFDRVLPKIREDYEALETQVNGLGAAVSKEHASFSTLVDRRASLRASLALWEQVVELRDRRTELEQSSGGPEVPSVDDTDLSTATADQFALQVEQILKSWDFPNAERVHFDRADRDLIIGGKKRGSRGKGLRSITHAAFTMGLLEFCRTQDRSHPGFAILDSPLLAYREPEGEEDDLTGTNVQERFYDELSRLSDRQVIVIENYDPPAHIRGRPASTFFSKNPHTGRYGFFPMSASEEAAV